MPTKRKAYMLRTVAADMTGYGGFVWPSGGPVEAADWNALPTCGYGLHGLLWGEGDAHLLDWTPDARWLVVEVDAAEVVDLGGKIKVPRGTVIYCGDRKGATDKITRLGARGPVVGCFRVGGDRATVSGGYGATVSGGYRATVSGGDGATVSGGYGATVSGGDEATVSGGYGATVSGGYRATVSGGEGAILQLQWFDGARRRLAIAYVGEDGIEPNVAYRCHEGAVVKA